MTETKETRLKRNVIDVNQEALETSLEMQMALMEASTLCANELVAFGARRAEATVRDMAALGAAGTPREVLGAQVARMRAMVRDYTEETGRLLDIVETVSRRGRAGVDAALRQRR